MEGRRERNQKPKEEWEEEEHLEEKNPDGPVQVLSCSNTVEEVSWNAPAANGRSSLVLLV